MYLILLAVSLSNQIFSLNAGGWDSSNLCLDLDFVAWPRNTQADGNTMIGNYYQTSVGDDGTLWATGYDDWLYGYSCSIGDQNCVNQGEIWIKSQNNRQWVSVGSSSNIWSITANKDNIYKKQYGHDPYDNYWQNMQLSANQVDAASDGTGFSFII